MVKAIRGMLIQCDASIKAIIRKIDQKHGGQFIQEDIDDETLTINANKLAQLKHLLKEELKDTVREAEESGSD